MDLFGEKTVTLQKGVRVKIIPESKSYRKMKCFTTKLEEKCDRINKPLSAARVYTNEYFLAACRRFFSQLSCLLLMSICYSRGTACAKLA